jgi:hypothetical protein
VATHDTADRIRELNEQIIGAAGEAGSTYLDIYERALASMAGYQEQLAAATPLDWMQRVLEAQATFMRDIGELYASTARELIKQ